MAKNKSIEETFISAQYKDFKYLLYKGIIKESMIWLQKEFKKNQQIKEDVIACIIEYAKPFYKLKQIGRAHI